MTNNTTTRAFSREHAPFVSIRGLTYGNGIVETRCYDRARETWDTHNPPDQPDLGGQQPRVRLRLDRQPHPGRADERAGVDGGVHDCPEQQPGWAACRRCRHLRRRRSPDGRPRDGRDLNLRRRRAPLDGECGRGAEVDALLQRPRPAGGEGHESARRPGGADGVLGREREALGPSVNHPASLRRYIFAGKVETPLDFGPESALDIDGPKAGVDPSASTAGRPRR